MDALTNKPSLNQIAANIASITLTMNENIVRSAILLGEQYRLARDGFRRLGGSDLPDAPRPGWWEWIATNTSWHPTTARSFIRVFDRACEDPDLWQREAPSLTLPLFTLFKLASPRLDNVYRRALFHRVHTEKLTKDQVSDILKARNSGVPVKPRRSKRGREQFKNAVRTVCQLCETVRELPIPYLDKDELTAMIDELEEAKGNLGRILSELKEDLK